MVNGYDRELWATALDSHIDGGLVEGGIDVVDGNGIVGVGRVAADIAHDAEPATRRLQALLVDEWWDGLGQIYAVDKDVRLDNLRIRAVALLGLFQIPLLDLGAANLFEQVDSARSAPTEGAEDQAGGLVSGNLLASGNIVLELGDQLALVVVEAASVGEGFETGEGLAVGVGELPCPCLVL